MFLISEENLKNWTSQKNTRYPKVAATYCPFCTQQVTFSINFNSYDQDIMTGRGNCPNCNQAPIFVWVNAPTAGIIPSPSRTYIHPSPNRKQPIDGLPPDISEPLKRDYLSALTTYNIHEWNSAVVMCRRALERITKLSIPESEQGKTLYQNLGKLPKHIDLVAPLTELMKQVKDSGNLGAHVDAETEPDQELASLTIELVEFLLDYLYILPSKIKSLEQRMQEQVNEVETT